MGRPKKNANMKVIPNMIIDELPKKPDPLKIELERLCGALATVEHSLCEVLAMIPADVHDDIGPEDVGQMHVEVGSLRRAAKELERRVELFREAEDDDC